MRILAFILLAILLFSCDHGSIKIKTTPHCYYDSIRLRSKEAFDKFPKIYKTVFKNITEKCDSADLNNYIEGALSTYNGVYVVVFYNDNSKRIIEITQMSFYFRDSFYNYLGYFFYKEKLFVFYEDDIDKECFDENILLKSFPPIFLDEKNLKSEALRGSDFAFVKFEMITCDSILQTETNKIYLSNIIYR